MTLDALNEAIDDLGPVRKDFDRHSSTGAPYVTHPTDTTKSGAPKKVQYGRPSGHGGRLEDKSQLTNWKLRVAAYGIATSKALVAGIAALDPEADKSDLDRLVQQAIEAGKGNEAADVGTALHRMTERVDLGTIPVTKVPEVFKADVEALLAAREAAGLTVVDGMVELHAVCDELRLAGTFDRVLTDGTTRYIGDLKTGKVTYSGVNYTVQLAVYSRSMLYDVETGKRSPLDVDQQVGIIEHLPAGTGTCEILAVDLARGWELAKLADLVKVEAKTGCTFGPFVGGGTTTQPGHGETVAQQDVGSVEDNQPTAATTPSTDPGEAADREAAVASSSPDTSPGSATLAAVQHQADVAWALNRVTAIKDAGHIRTLTGCWPEGAAKPKAIKDGETWSPDELEQIIEALDRTEARWEMQFGTERPSATAARDVERDQPEPVRVHQLPQPDDNSDEQASDDNVRTLRGILETYLADDEYRPRGQAVLRWGTEAVRQNRPFAMGDPDAERPSTTSERRYRICLAALDLASELLHPTHDEPEFGVRMALGLVLGEELQPTWTTGAVLGSLTTEQAIRLADIAATHRASILEDGTPQLTAAA